MKATLKWNGPGVLAEIHAKSWEGIQRAVAFYHTKLLEALNVSNPRPYTTPSKPGEPPRKRTGWLQRNVAYELDEAKGEARIGVRENAKYGAYLELGTRFMKARPWLVATLKKHWNTIKALAGG